MENPFKLNAFMETTRQQVEYENVRTSNFKIFLFKFKSLLENVWSGKWKLVFPYTNMKVTIMIKKLTKPEKKE